MDEMECKNICTKTGKGILRDGKAFYRAESGKEFSLKELVEMRAVLLYSDSGIYLDGKNEVGERKISKETIMVEIETLNALSAALKSTADVGC